MRSVKPMASFCFTLPLYTTAETKEKRSDCLRSVGCRLPFRVPVCVDDGDDEADFVW